MELNDSQGVLNLSKNSASFYTNQGNAASFSGLDSSLNESAASPLNLSSNQSSFTPTHSNQMAAAAAALLRQNASMPDLNSLQHVSGHLASFAAPSPLHLKPNQTRYQQLLSVIDEMGKDIRTTYMGNKNSTERLKRSIASARILVKDCLLECERNTKT